METKSSAIKPLSPTYKFPKPEPLNPRVAPPRVLGGDLIQTRNEVSCCSSCAAIWVLGLGVYGLAFWGALGQVGV